MRPMRLPPFPRIAITAALFAGLVVGCGDGSAVTEDSIAATAGEATLTVGQLTALLTRSPVQPTEVLAFGMASAWIDHALAIEHLAELSQDPIASDATAQARQDSVVQRLIAARRDAARQPTRDEVDSIGRRDNVRVFRMYALAVIPGDTASRITATAAFEALRDAALTAHTSPTEQTDALDRTTRDALQITDLPAAERRDLPPALAEQVWPLRAGEMTRPLLTQGMVQLFYRVPRPTADVALGEWTRGALQVKADEALIDSLLAARHFAVPDDVADRIRSAFVDPGLITGDAPIATWDGGETSPDEALAWIRTLPPAVRAARVGASDADLVAMAKAAGRRELIQELWRGTDTTGVGAAVRRVYDSQIALLRSDAQQVAQGSTTAQRAYVWSTAEASLKVPFRTEPSGLGAALRSRTSVDVDAVAVRAALKEAARIWVAPGSALPTDNIP
jgi:hypothetical protein